MTDSMKSAVAVDRSVVIRFVFSYADQSTACVVTVKTGNPCELAREHWTVEHSPESPNCTRIQLVWTHFAHHNNGPIQYKISNTLYQCHADTKLDTNSTDSILAQSVRTKKETEKLLWVILKSVRNHPKIPKMLFVFYIFWGIYTHIDPDS